MSCRDLCCAIAMLVLALSGCPRSPTTDAPLDDARSADDTSALVEPTEEHGGVANSPIPSPDQTAGSRPREADQGSERDDNEKQESPPKGSPDEIEEILIVVIEHQAKKYQGILDSKKYRGRFLESETASPTYFLSVKQRDPRPSLLNYFRTHGRFMRNGSRFKPEAGVLLRVEGWTWISSEQIEVRAGYHESGLSSDSVRYTLVRESGKWQIEAEKTLWIS